MDEPHLEHGRVERSRARDVVDLLRLPEQLADLAAVVAREVRAHALAQVRCLADVEGTASCIAEEVHAGPPRQSIGEAELGRLRMRVDAGSASRSSSPSTPKAAARSSRKWSRSAVASASSRARCDGWCERRKRLARVDNRQFGTSSRTSRRASAHVSTHRCVIGAHPEARRAGAEEAEIEAHVVADDHRARAELDERREHRLDAGRRHDHRLGDAGEHRDLRRDRHARVHEGLERAEALAASHLDRADLGDGAALGRSPCGLEVDDAERDVRQGRAEVVERALHGGTIRRTGVRAQEHTFGTRVPPVRCPPCHPLGTAAARAGTSPASTW